MGPPNKKYLPRRRYFLFGKLAENPVGAAGVRSSSSLAGAGTENERRCALPTSGPWHKIAEAIDLANSVRSNRVLVTHNGLYNDAGNHVANNFIKANISDKDRDFVFLEPGESLG